MIFTICLYIRSCGLNESSSLLEGVDVAQQDSSVGKSLVSGSFLSPMEDDLSGGENDNENPLRPSCVSHDSGVVHAEVRLMYFVQTHKSISDLLNVMHMYDIPTS